MKLSVRPVEQDATLGDFRGSLHSGHGLVEVVDRPIRVSGGVLDADSGQAGFDRRLDRRLDVAGLWAKAVLQVTVNG